MNFNIKISFYRKLLEKGWIDKIWPTPISSSIVLFDLLPLMMTLSHSIISSHTFNNNAQRKMDFHKHHGTIQFFFKSKQFECSIAHIIILLLLLLLLLTNSQCLVVGAWMAICRTAQEKYAKWLYIKYGQQFHLPFYWFLKTVLFSGPLFKKCQKQWVTQIFK